MLSNGSEEGEFVQGLAEENGVWFPASAQEKEKVRQQMNRLLETSHFRNSKRYPALFRFIVEETLAGRGEFLKERLIGVSVFDRPPDYDTASDPIVRVTIAEIRKRIAQYYHEEAHDAEMRIELLPGHYEPEFRPRRDSNQDRLIPAQLPDNLGVLATDVPDHNVRAAATGTRKRVLVYTFATLALAGMAVASVFLWQMLHPSAIDEFWAPLVAANRTVTFCLPTAGIGATIAEQAGILAPGTSGTAPSSQASDASSHDATFLDHEAAGENVVFSDVLATQEISNLLIQHNRESKLRLASLMTLDDLRQGPAVLIGGLDNSWSLRTLAQLPYRFAGNKNNQYWIADKKNPQKKDWGIDLTETYASVDHDFALIARVHDQSTGQVVVIVAGIGMSGTAAAGGMLVDPKQMQELRRQVGPGFRDRDFEAILSTDVVNGIAGTPKILTVAVF
jgi:hypothetical protein